MNGISSDLKLSNQSTKLQEFYSQGLERLNEALTSLEIEQLKTKLGVNVFVKASPLLGTDDNASVRSLATTIKGVIGKGWKKHMASGSFPNIDKSQNKGPYIVVITLSATRAVNVIRGLKSKLASGGPGSHGHRGFKRGGRQGRGGRNGRGRGGRGGRGRGKKFRSGPRIAKLFARHQKVAEQEEFLKAGCGLAVGTPNRLLKLCESGILSWNNVKLVCFDTFKDKKKMNMFTIRDTEADVHTLFHKHIYKGILSVNAKVCFF
mmetsp:Transcript_3401/g.5096  ORF Transcript_3401/g.5096 Transcript_3401/m.5096 type:complete len:263 (+) Transcript_3401:133-921(+)